MERNDQNTDKFDLSTFRENLVELSLHIESEKLSSDNIKLEDFDAFGQLLDYITTISFLNVDKINEILQCIKETFDHETTETVITGLLKGLLGRQKNIESEVEQDQISHRVRALISTEGDVKE
jgi:hypothetical protein